MVVFLLIACNAPCPEGAAADAGRRARLAELLGGTEAASVPADSPPVCFGATSGWNGTVILLEDAPDADLAARWAHLAQHVGRDPGRFTADRPCDAQIEESMQLEADAWALEARLRTGFGLPVQDPPLEQIRKDYTIRCAQL